VSDKLHALAAFLPGKKPRYSINRSLGGPQSRSGPFGAEKIILPMPGIEHRPSSSEFITIPTEQSRIFFVMATEGGFFRPRRKPGYLFSSGTEI
jgi:hypothetical protein